MFHDTFKTPFGKFSLRVVFFDIDYILIEIALIQLGEVKILYSESISLSRNII